MEQNLIRLVYQAGDSQSVIDGLRKSTTNLKALIESLNGSMKAGDLTADEYTKKLSQLGREYQRQTGLLDEMEKAAAEAERAKLAAIANAGSSAGAWGAVFQNAATAAKDAAEAEKKAADATDAATAAVKKKGDAAKEATNKMAGLGQAGLQAGRIVQDFAQGGFAGILNNIEGATRAVGLGPGFAGALTIAGVAAYLFGDKIKAAFNIKDPVDAALTMIGSIEKKIKDLQDKPHKLAVDVSALQEATKMLEQAKKDLASFAEMQQQKTKREQRAGAVVNEVIQESNGPVLSKQLHEAAARQIEAKDPVINAASKALFEKVNQREVLEKRALNVIDPDMAVAINQQVVDLTNEIENAKRDIAVRKQAIRNPTEGEAAQAVGHAREEALRGRVGELADLSRAAGRGSVAETLEQSTPQALEEQDRARKAIGHFLEVQSSVQGKNLKNWLHARWAEGQARRNAERQKNTDANKAMYEQATRDAAARAKELEGRGGPDEQRFGDATNRTQRADARGRAVTRARDAATLQKQVQASVARRPFRGQAGPTRRKGKTVVPRTTKQQQRKTSDTGLLRPGVNLSALAAPVASVAQAGVNQNKAAQDAVGQTLSAMQAVIEQQNGGAAQWQALAAQAQQIRNYVQSTARAGRR